MSFLVVFDLDNTLVHSQIDFAGMRAAIIQLLRERDLSAAGDNELRRLSVGEIIASGAQFNGEFQREAWQRVLEFERAGMLKASVEEDAARTLGVLQSAGFQLAILTNNAREATLDALEKFALYSYFDLILTRDEVAMKPKPDGILKAKTDLNAERAFHVGDSWLDGAAANRAEVPFIAFRAAPDAFTNHRVEVWKTAQQLCELPEILRSSLVESPQPTE
jgi:phosphoglycolate phosphatase